jgi:hypothetical protein
MHCALCVKLQGGANPKKPEFYQWDPEGKDICVLCAINNLFQTLGGEYTAEEFGAYIDTLRAEKGLEALGLRSWFNVEDIVTSVFDKNIIHRRDDVEYIYDDETALIWIGTGDESHLVAVSDGWLFDSKSPQPINLLRKRKDLGNGLVTMARGNKDTLRGVWLIDIPTKSTTPENPIAVFHLVSFSEQDAALKEARAKEKAVADAAWKNWHEVEAQIKAGIEARMAAEEQEAARAAEAARAPKRSLTREWLAMEKKRKFYFGD